MIKLLKNEFIKLRYAKSVKIVLLVLVLFSILSVAVMSGAGKGYGSYGYQMPYASLLSFGALGFFAYASIAAGLIAGEFENGMIHNIICTGISRKKYYVSKFIAVLGVSEIIYLIVMVLQMGMTTVRFEFGTPQIMENNYWLSVLVYTVGAMIVLGADISIYILLAFLIRNQAYTFAASIALATGEMLLKAILSKRGISAAFLPMGIADKMLKLSEEGKVLSAEFCVLILPCIVILLVCAFAGYWLFQKKDIK